MSQQGSRGVFQVGVLLMNNDIYQISGNGAPTNGTSGTYATRAGKGSIYIDYTNGVVYLNTGTKASPTWTVFTPTAAASADGLGAVGMARATFNPTAVTGDRTVATHSSAFNIPDKAVVIGGFVEVETAMTSADTTGTLAVSIEAANDIISAANISGAPWSTTGPKAIVPKNNTPESTSIKLTAARAVKFTVGTTALTGGKATAFLAYVQGA